MKLDLQTLIVAGVKPTQARTWVDPLAAVLPQFNIDDPRRIAAFLGQVLVESAMLTAVEENLWYSKPDRLQLVYGKTRFPTLAVAAQYTGQPQKLANFVYANRGGNGDVASGDGWKYRGRGLIQTTLKNNYRNCELVTGNPYLSNPDLLINPADAALAAAVYWSSNNLNRKADAWDIDGITRAVNGKAMLDKERRAEISSLIVVHLRKT